MSEQKTGIILNIASIAAWLPGPLMATYYASKAYVLSFSLALAEELKDSVSVACPGPTVSNFGPSAGVNHSLAFRRGMSSSQVANYLSRSTQRQKAYCDWV